MIRLQKYFGHNQTGHLWSEKMSKNLLINCIAVIVITLAVLGGYALLNGAFSFSVDDGVPRIGVSNYNDAKPIKKLKDMEKRLEEAKPVQKLKDMSQKVINGLR